MHRAHNKPGLVCLSVMLVLEIVDSVIGNCGDLRGSSDYRLGFYKTLKVSWKIHVMGLEHIFTARNKWIPQTRIGQTTLLCR